MNQNHYWQKLEELLREYYTIIHTINKVSERQEQYIQGFLAAGRYLGIVTEAEQMTVIEGVHHDIFGESVEQRKSSQRTRPASSEDYYNVPTWLRKGVKLRFEHSDNDHINDLTIVTDLLARES
ncbi:hypothetical protein [Kistimonas asteriae]|uniref:hypothetical protein n=1 Tax=Kistimonas asteriae TaxID=517724 RepID=UPI001BA5C152|nr:hypothetical protein [Kistimonas asteriae]